MLEDVELAFKNLSGRQRRKARRMLNRATQKKDPNRMNYEMDEVVKYIRKCGG